MIKKRFFALLFAFQPLFSLIPVDLSHYEKALYSQNGEDGVLSKIFQLIRPSTRYCVELGAADGITSSNTYLLRLQGWDCLLLDRAYEFPQHHLHKEFITAENLNELFEKYQVPFGLDLLSIDIDYNDFYIWKALDSRYQPAVVVIKYNPFFSADADVVVKYHPFFVGDGSDYYGASILALFRLGRSKGYSLVYADQSGSNLFFIRDDLLLFAEVSFKDMNDVLKIYRPAAYTVPASGKGLKSFTSSDQLIP